MIRAVFFDAVGTLIVPQPAPTEVYFEVGRRHGSSLTCAEIGRRFRLAFKVEDEIDRAHAWKTDELREEQRWRTIVGTVLDDVNDSDACFHDLWCHFSNAEAWRCVDGVKQVLSDLAQRGYVLGMASNFDARLRNVAAGLPELQPLQHLVISSEIGWRKPARQFFEQAAGQASLSAAEIMFVGDDPINDGEGARTGGMPVVILNRDGNMNMLPALLDLLPGTRDTTSVS
jgi:putative hydrolase of the HAD superfamily